MTANELRIGNFIMYSDIKKVFDVNLWFFTELDARISYINDFEPIPLTEEWLNKFSLNGYEIPFNDEKGGAIDFSDINDLYLVNQWHENFPLNKIQYVHQLQNLYFALTGQELELKTE